jgi:hypothetical protein
MKHRNRNLHAVSSFSKGSKTALWDTVIMATTVGGGAFAAVLTLAPYFVR